MSRSIILAAAVGGALALWFYSGSLTARDVMTPKCRERVDYLAAAKHQLVRPASDYAFDDVVRGNLASSCGALNLWGRL